MDRCYIYVIRDGDAVAYVGKGSGKRLARQSAKFNLPGEVVEECATDAAAFKAERKWIAALNPALNIYAGGNGNRRHKRSPRQPTWVRQMEAVGLRRYSARLLLNCERARPGIIDPSKVEAIRQVAHGRWC